tara:strand:- start:12466 stop:12699 length:234 start_codon:yes stop_codon:yes gene_type:complete
MKSKIGYLVVVLFWSLTIGLLSSCTSYKQHYRIQKSDYSQCWCIDPWVGAAEWCCSGYPPKHMNPYNHRKGFIKAKF